MGLLDDAIREHLDLKRRRGADPTEIERAEREALGPVRRGPEVTGDEAASPAPEPEAEYSPAPDEQWEAFRGLPAVRSALDGAPDPVNGLIIYRGRGGGSGPRKPRKPKPEPGASAMALPEPAEERVLHLAGVAPPGKPQAV